MEQFVVPQFIDVEDKILGPITTRQFIILLAVGLLIFIFYKLLAFGTFLFIGLLLIIVGGALAFVRINGQPFHFFLLNVFQTFRSPSLQVWDKTVSDEMLKASLRKKDVVAHARTPRKKFLTTSRLDEISLVVDTGGVYEPEQ